MTMSNHYHPDTALLQDLAQGSVSAEKLNALAKQQLSEISHAMTFSRVQTIVYCTCSTYPEENEEVISQALQLEGIKGPSYKISPPLIPLCSSEDVESASENFLKIEPSKTSNGCFLAVLTRERDPSQCALPQDVLARAASKGLLHGVDVQKSLRREKKKPKSAQSKINHRPTANQAKINEFLNRENSLNSPKMQQNSKISFQTRKPTKPEVTPTSSTTLKTASGHSKILERRPTTIRPKPEDKIMLRPFQVPLPPVMSPSYMNLPIAKTRTLNYYYHQPWHAGSRIPPSYKPILPLTGKTKAMPPSSAVRHPRPWH